MGMRMRMRIGWWSRWDAEEEGGVEAEAAAGGGMVSISF